MFKRGRVPARRWLQVAVTAVLSTALVAGCQGGADPGTGGSGNEGDRTQERSEPEPEPEPTPQARVAISPADGSQGVELDASVMVTSTKGRISDVVVTEREATDAAGGDVQPAAERSDADDDDASAAESKVSVLDGSLDNNATQWVASGGLAPDTTYEVSATAVDANGLETTRTQTFETMSVDSVLEAEVIPNGQTVGVGHPIVITFNYDVPDDAKAAVEEALVVDTDEDIEGAWHWFTDDTAHYRPKEYWPAYTDVAVRLNLQGVRAGDGVWGVENEVAEFSIGQSVISKVDLSKHNQKVYIDGELAKTIPITGGQPGWETRSGTKVVLEVRTDVTLRSETIGVEDEDSEHYYNMFAPYALRVTWSGEFLHSADWSTWAHGNSNVSHGCVGMSVANSKWLWERSQVGDVVENVGSDKPMDISGNGYGDWNLSWDEWLAGSALAE